LEFYKLRFTDYELRTIKMTIKNTKSKGFSITSNGSEAILKGDHIELIRPTDEGNQEPYEIRSSGEYDLGRIGVEASKISNADGLCYLLFADEITVGYFPFPPEQMTEKIIEKFDTIDILLIDGNAGEIAETLSPGIIIPLNNGEEFAKYRGAALPEVSNTLTINSSDQLPEETTVINLG